LKGFTDAEFAISYLRIRMLMLYF